MDVVELIERLDRLAHNAKRVPRSDHVRMKRQEVRDILDQIRAAIPAEIKEARWIARERQDMLAEAKREADQIGAEARELQTELARRHELVLQAERAAEQIIENARGRERDIRLGAEDYADEILNTLELNLGKLMAAIQRGRERLRDTDERPELG